MGALKTYLLAALLSLPALAQAQAWKCQINGKTVFSDVPCPKEGQAIDLSKLQGNTVAPVRAPRPAPRVEREEYATAAPLGSVQEQSRGGGPPPATARSVTCKPAQVPSRPARRKWPASSSRCAGRSGAGPG